MKRVTRPYLEIHPTDQPPRETLASVASELRAHLSKNTQLDFLVHNLDGPIRFYLGIDPDANSEVKPRPSLKQMARSLVEYLPDGYDYGLTTVTLPPGDSFTGFVRWTPPTEFLSFTAVEGRTLADLLTPLEVTHQAYLYQLVLSEDPKSGSLEAVPRLIVEGEAIGAVVHAFQPLGFVGHRYGPAHGAGEFDALHRRVAAKSTQQHRSIGGDPSITLADRDLGHFLDFPLEASAIAEKTAPSLGPGVEPIQDLFASRETEFLRIEPSQIQAPRPLEELAEALYRGEDALGDIELLYSIGEHTELPPRGIYIRPGSNSLQALCDRLGTVCSEDHEIHRVEFRQETFTDWNLHRFYVPESADFERQNLPRSLSNRVLATLEKSVPGAVVQVIGEHYHKGDSAFVTTIRIATPPGTDFSIPQSLLEAGLEPMEPEGSSAFVEGRTELVGQLPRAGHERIFLPVPKFAGLIQISPFWDRDNYLPAKADDLEIETIPDIRSTVPPIDYDEPIAITQEHRPDTIQYNVEHQEYVCTECGTRYPAPLRTEGPQELEEAFTCCSATLEEVNFEAVRQPALAGITDSLADEWGLPQAILEFLILVSKAHAKHLDPRWEYNYRDSMVALRNDLDLEKGHVDDLRAESGSGTPLLRVQRSRKKYYELTEFGRKLVSHIRTTTENSHIEFGDVSESILHVIGQVTTEQFVSLLPGVSETATEVPVNTLLEESAVTESIWNGYATRQIDVVGFGSDGDPRYLVEFETDGEHAADTRHDAAKMGLVASEYDIPVGFVTPDQEVGKDIVQIIKNQSHLQLGVEDATPLHLGDPELLIDRLELPQSAVIAEATKALLTAPTPLSFILPLNHVIDNVLEMDEMRQSLENGAFGSLSAALGTMYATQYKHLSLEEFLE